MSDAEVRAALNVLNHLDLPHKHQQHQLSDGEEHQHQDNQLQVNQVMQ